MDREKLNKAADTYAHEHTWYPGETSYESDIIAMEEAFSDTFKAGADWLLTQPLSSRLTEEEKEKIRGLYGYLNSALGYCHKSSDSLLINATMTMERIFGTSLFNDKSE